MKHINLYIKYILLTFIAIIATACSSGSCDSNSDNQEVIMDSSDGGVANGATDVSLSPSIVLQFKQPMNASTVNSSTTILTDATNNQVIEIGQIVANNDNTKFYFSPVQQLQPGTKYIVSLTSKIKTATGTSITPTSFSFTTTTNADMVNPTVSIIEPGNDANNVVLAPNIQVKFSEAVQNVNTTTVTLRQGSPTGSIVATGNIVAGADNTYTFSPSSPLDENTTYYVVLTNAITDIAGNQLIAKSFSFTTGEITVPTVLMTTPSNNATNVPTTPNITLQFSEAVQNVNTTTVTLRQGSLTGSIVATGNIIAGADNTYTFSPASALSDDTTYYVVLTNGITDMSGNALAPISFSFTTGNFNAPTVAMTTPSNNATNVPTTPNITLQFSEAVQNVESATVTLRQGSESGTVIATGNIVAGADNTYTFSPESALNDNTTYYVVLTNTITDMSGNALAPISFSFTTGDFNAPTVSMITPSNNSESASLTPAITLKFSKVVQNVNTTTVTLHQGSATGTSIATTSIVPGANNTYTFSPESTSPLESNTAYYVVLTNAITDTLGRQLESISFNFTTAKAWQNVGNAGFSDPNGISANFVSLAIAPNGTPYVGYQDELSISNKKPMVMMFNGANWESVDQAGFSLVKEATSISLAVAPNNTPFIAFRDDDRSGGPNQLKITVMMLNGANWDYVGESRFSQGSHPSLAINESGTPYVAYQDTANSDKITVMRFNGANWESVGQAGFSAGTSRTPSLALAPNGSPYVAYEDDTQNDRTTVMRFNGTNWENVGNPGFSNGSSSGQSIAIAPDGTPYVAYRDGLAAGFGNDGKTMVMMFDGTSWNPVGNPTGISAGEATQQNLKIAPNGTPYVSYGDGVTAKPVVMMFNGIDWVVVGNIGFSGGMVYYPSLALAPDGTPYLAYKDFANSTRATVMNFQ